MKEQMLTIYKWSQKIGNNDTGKKIQLLFQVSPDISGMNYFANLVWKVLG